MFLTEQRIREIVREEIANQRATDIHTTIKVMQDPILSEKVKKSVIQSLTESLEAACDTPLRHT